MKGRKTKIRKSNRKKRLSGFRTRTKTAGAGRSTVGSAVVAARSSRSG